MNKLTLSEIDSFAQRLLAQLQPQDIVLLSGDLGAGKTTLTKAIANQLGITQPVTSPTFTIMNVYQTAHPNITQLCHIDTYRLESEDEFAPLGIDEFLGAPNTLAIVEWPDRLPKHFFEIPDARYIDLALIETEDNDVRQVSSKALSL